jgi:prepilin-type N-terminal cleavage/methylation domain-containing protein
MRKRKSFTLIELLVVIVIIGILAGVIMVSTSSSISKANLAKAQSFCSIVNNELLLNLVSEWTFDEGPTSSGLATNNDVKDLWGSNNGDITSHAPNILTGSDCIFNKCLQFLGSTSYVTYSDSDSLDIENAITISAWIKTTSTAQQIIAQKSANSTFVDPWRLYALLVTPESSILKVRLSLSTGVVGTQIQLKGNTNVSLNEWHYIVGTWSSGKNAKIYLDGKDDNSTGLAFNNLIGKNNEPFRMANSPTNTERFYGNIDEVRLYNRALSLSEIKQKYIAGLDSLLAKKSISKEDYNQRISELAYEK